MWIRFCVQRMVKCDVILNPPSLPNPGYASGSLLVRIVDFFYFFKLISVIFDEVQRSLIFFNSKTLNFQIRVLRKISFRFEFAA